MAHAGNESEFGWIARECPIKPLASGMKVFDEDEANLELSFGEQDVTTPFLEPPGQRDPFTF